MEWKVKTIIARFSEVKKLRDKGMSTGLDEEGEAIDVNKIATALSTVGISMNAFFAGTEGLDSVLMKLASKWNTLDFETQKYIATTAAGSRQQSRFIALMSNYNRTVELTNAANNSAGASQEQYEKTLASLETKITKLTNAYNEFLMSMTNSDVIKTGIDLLTGFLNILNKIVNTTSGGNSFGKFAVSIGLVTGALVLGKKALHSFFSRLTIGNGEVKKSVTEFLKLKETTKEMSEEMMHSQKVLNTTAGVAAGLGVALSTLGGYLKEQAGDWEEWGDILTVAGGILMTIPITTKIAGSAIKLFAGESTAAINSIPIVGWAIAAVTALAAIGTAIYKIVKNNNYKKSLQYKIDTVKQATEAAKKAAEEANDAYNEFLNDKNQYNELQNTLDNLIVGTDEWRQKLIEANKQVLELIKTYPELTKYIERNENGILTIREEGLQQYEETLSKQSEQSAQMVSGLTAYETVLENKDYFSKGYKNYKNGWTQFGWGLLEALGGAGYEQDYGRSREIETYQFLLDYGFEGAFSSTSITKRDEAITQAYEQLLNGINIEKIDTTDLKDSDIKKLKEIQKTIDSREKEVEIKQAQAIESLLYNAQDKLDISNIEDGDKLIDVISQSMATSYDEMMSETAQKIKDENKGITELRRQYKDATGQSIESITEEFGDDVDALITALASLEVGDNIINSVNKLAGAIGKLGGVDQQRALALFSGQYGKLSLNEIIKINPSVTTYAGYAREMGITTDTNNKNAANALAQSRGYQWKTVSELPLADQQAYLKWLQKNDSDNYGKTTTIEDIKDLKISPRVQMEIDDEALRKAAEKQAKDYTDKFDKAIGEEDIGKTLNLEELQKLLPAVSAFSNPEKAKQYYELLKGMDEEFKSIAMNNDFGSINSILSTTFDLINAGMDADKVSDYYDIATQGANNYISSLENIGRLIGTIQSQYNKSTDALKALEEGKATQEQLNSLLSTGAIDMSDVIYDLSTGGWKLANASKKESLTKAVRQRDAQYSIDEINNIEKAFDTTIKNAEKIVSGIGKNGVVGDFIELNEDGKYVLNYGDNSDLNSAIQRLTGNRLTQNENETPEQFRQRQEDVLNGIIQQLNNEKTVRETYAAQRAAISSSGLTRPEAFVKGGTRNELIAVSRQEAQNAGLDMEAWEEYYNYLKEIKRLQPEIAAAAATANLKMNKGVKALAESYEDWQKIIDTTTGKIKINGAEDAQIYKDLKSNLSDIFGIDEAKISDEFIEKNIQSIITAITDPNATSKVFEELGQQLGSSLLGGIENELGAGAYDLRDIYSRILSNLPTIEIGANVEISSNYLNMIQELMNTNEKAAASFISLLEMSGVEAVYEYEDVTTYNANGESYTREEKVFKGFVKTDKYKNLSIPTRNAIGSNGGGSSDKWTNPYDKFYNLTQQINSALREREKIEREYNRILEDRTSSVTQLVAKTAQEISNLREQQKLQKQLAQGKLSQIRNAQYETFVDDNGNETTYYNMGASRYASFDETTGQITINWEAINTIRDTKLGSAIESYIGLLEEYVSAYEGAIDAAEDALDAEKELIKARTDTYLGFEQTVYDAVVAQQQKQIDNYQAVADSINESNTKIYDALRESIDLERQIRDNTKKEEEITDLEARLAYLRMGSGGNELEILKLQKELEEKRESYSDSLIDQEIDRLEDIDTKAYEQRQEQISLMQQQLDWNKENGVYWGTVAELLHSSIDSNGMLINNSALVSLMKETEAFKGMSYFGKENWVQNFVSQWKAAQEGYNIMAMYSNYGRNVPAYATGGLVTDTGLAWLDGTTTSPELVLSARDTENFIHLKDILSDVMRGTSTIAPQSSGDIQFKIDIHVDEIGSSYDVDRLGEDIKKKIFQEASYRNVNVVSLMR